MVLWLMMFTNVHIFVHALCSYIHYSRVCARVVRRCLKPELRNEAMKRDEGFIRAIFWKDGKPMTSIYYAL